MNYNDIKFRIERTLESLKGRFDEDVESHENYEFYTRGNEQRVSITWGTKDEKKLLNSIMSILHNLASLKDHLKNALKEKGHDPQIVEDEINNSLHLQVLIDIVNQEKHGSPLKKPRSNKNPVIDYPRQGFYMASVIRDEDGNVLSKDGPPTMKIDALIRDGDKNILFYHDELVETCYAKWRAIARKYNCI